MYLVNGSYRYFLNILKNSKKHMKRFQKFTLLRLPTALSVNRRLYLLFLIQNSVVTNSREDIAENIIEYMYQIMSMMFTSSIAIWRLYPPYMPIQYIVLWSSIPEDTFPFKIAVSYQNICRHHVKFSLKTRIRMS